MTLRRLAVAALAALALAPAAPAAARPRPGGTMTLESARARFRCAAPRWKKSEDPAQDAREKVYGVTLRERGAARPAAQITIEWYAPGNGLFATADDYVAVNASTAGAVAGAGAGPVRRARIAGRPARRWTAATFTVSAPNMVRGARVEVRSDTVVVEGAEGFYALSFSAPARAFEAGRAAFQRLLDTFEPLP